jgi:predicted nucleotidyltransferase
MNNKLRIISCLLENHTIEVNIRNISEKTGINYKNTYDIIKELEKQGIIKLETFGKSTRVLLIEKINPLIFQAEYTRKETLLKNKNLKVMLEYFKDLGTSMYVMLLFGSYAKGTNTKNSDIDLMFIVPDSLEEEMERKIVSIKEIIPMNIHLNLFSEKDFIAMKESKKTTVGSEAIINNIILHGIEQYYEMIQ